ncbi:hypothetical protein DENIS_2354 [Desulfonema ishimotonii]|uniref:CopG family transcriptional regulator n=1 Tax=Desulfonema ishimotonii TaxID=45657 RepID=A0A401FWT7_9BACT|nr:hypothetical protein [Desulfonema ishimotonii]GBC61394.1 hypothetical protein DENIS_2354 [Desulfonema ishimotonii]
MNTQKVAITIPKHLVMTIDTMSRQQGISRSRLISRMLEEKVAEEKKRLLKDAYDTVFSDESLCKEQLETVRWFEGADEGEGQEW